MATPIHDTKAALRRRVRAELNHMTPTRRTEASAQACALLQQQPIWLKAKSVLFFAPLADEPDLWPLLENALGISEEAIREQKNVRYIRDIGEAMMQVQSGAVNVAFLMNPVRMTQVRDIAFVGEVLPQKSTDFYPKLLSGLTIYALD